MSTYAKILLVVAGLLALCIAAIVIRGSGIEDPGNDKVASHEIEGTPLPDRVLSIHEAARIGDLRSVKDLVERGVNINEPDGWGFFPIHRAASGGNLEVFKLLHQAGAKLDQVSGMPYDDEVQMAMYKEFRSEPVRFQPIHEAASCGKLDIVKYLLDNQIPYNAKDNNGSTPLYWLHAKFATASKQEIAELEKLLDKDGQ